MSMDEENLILVEQGLVDLIKKYKKNLREGDLERAKAAQDAKAAIRKIILSVAIKGDILDIVPIIEEQKGAGFQIVDCNKKTIIYYS